MDATIALPGTIARPRPGAAIGAATRHVRIARRVAAAVALAATILAAVAGGLIDGAAYGRPDAPAPNPLPGLDIVVMIAR
jgi:hypothetical protein